MWVPFNDVRACEDSESFFSNGTSGKSIPPDPWKSFFEGSDHTSGSSFHQDLFLEIWVNDETKKGFTVDD